MDTGRTAKLGASLLAAGVLAGLAGCASTGREAPAAMVQVSLDRAAFKVGEPVIVTVSLRNRSEAAMILPRFDGKTAEFVRSTKGEHERIYCEPVESQTVRSEPREMGPGGSCSRRFLFTRLTEEPGQYALITKVNGLVADEEVLPSAVFSDPAVFSVSDEIAVRRDNHSGLILKEEAVRLASESAAGEVVRTGALLARLGDSGLYMWLVRLWVRKPGGGAQMYTVQVNPYLGTVRRFRTAATGQVKPDECGKPNADDGSGSDAGPETSRTSGSR